jgi:hypothetical protein
MPIDCTPHTIAAELDASGATFAVVDTPADQRVDPLTIAVADVLAVPVGVGNSNIDDAIRTLDGAGPEPKTGPREGPGATMVPGQRLYVAAPPATARRRGGR